MSTKTTLKRIALVAVSALGLSFATVTPSGAIPPWYGSGASGNAYTATYSAPSTFTLLDGYSSAATVGSINLSVSAPTGVDHNGNDATTATLTISRNSSSAADTAVFNALSVTESATDATSNATTNGAVTVGSPSGYSLDVDMAPIASGFLTASAKVTMKLNTGLTAAVANGGKLKYSISYVNVSGVKGTLDGTFTLSMGALSVAGTATASPSTLAANILAGGTATATVTTPYTIAAGATVTGPTFTLGGTVVNSSFNVTATATGGLVTVVRTSATTFASSFLKDANTGAFSATFTITVSAPSTAVNSEYITVSTPAGTYTATVFGGQTWNGTVTVSRAGNSSAAAGWLGGNTEAYGPAAVTTSTEVATVTVATGISASNPNLYPAWTFTMTGVGNFAVNGGNRSSYVVVPASAAGTAVVAIYADGRPGKGTLTVSANGNVVATQVVNFYGPAASISVVPLHTIARAGNGVIGYTLGELVSSAAAPCDVYTPAKCANWVGGNDPALAVVVKDALGTPLPIAMGTGGITMSSSNTAVIENNYGGSDSFLDAGVPTKTAGILLNHITVKSAASAKSGDSATLTFTYINSLGVALTATQKITVGGSTLGGTVTLKLDKTTYAPGERMVLTVTAKDASGNPVYDNKSVGAFSSNKNVQGITGTADALYADGSFVYGDDAGEDLFAPAATGSFDIILYTGTATGASIKVTANVSDDAATSAANAAADAALQAIDAANAATDAANMAAEAADAATMAAQDAKDAADAATAAVEKLAQDVAAMIDALKAQLKTLANIVAKIAKKVKA